MHFSITNPLCSAAPFKATVGSQGLRLPLDSSVDAGAVVEALFGLGKPSTKRKDAPDWELDDPADGRGDGLIGAGRRGHRGRDAEDDQQRGDQKAAAHAKQAGQKSDPTADGQENQRIHGKLGDRQIDVHGHAAN